MAELSVAYGQLNGPGVNGFDGTQVDNNYGPPMPAISSLNDPPVKQYRNFVQQQPAVAPEVVYQPPEAMYAQRPAPTATETFWDRLAHRKMEVYKMLQLALVVVLGLSIHFVTKHYWKTYLANGFFTTAQEFAVRAAYPVAVLLSIWVMKAL